MSVFRKLLFLLALLLLTGCAMFLLGENRFLSLSSVIRDGWDDTRYEAVSAGAGDTSAAATLDGDTLRLVCFTPQGEKLGERSVKLPNQDGGTVAALYCFQKDLLFAAVYDLNAHFLPSAGGRGGRGAVPGILHRPHVRPAQKRHPDFGHFSGRRPDFYRVFEKGRLTELFLPGALRRPEGKRTPGDKP